MIPRSSLPLVIQRQKTGYPLYRFTTIRQLLLLVYSCLCFYPLFLKCACSWSMKMLGYKSDSEDLKAIYLHQQPIHMPIQVSQTNNIRCPTHTVVHVPVHTNHHQAHLDKKI